MGFKKKKSKIERMKVNAEKLAQKKFGQNFLKDKSYIYKIIQAMPKESYQIAEIGPGLGDLTKELVRVGSVTAFEVDTRLCNILREDFSTQIEEGTLKLVCGDVLERWNGGSLMSDEYILVANLPYYIATNIILKGLKDPKCRYILTMVQKEVAQKFSARAGDRNHSALSVLAESCADAKLLFEVPPQAFVPPPKVTSAILEIDKHSYLDDKEFEKFLKTAFLQPRKQLMKNLSTKYPKEYLKGIFEDIKLQSNVRPHEVETSIYHRLYNELKKDRVDGKQQRDTGKQQ